MSGMRELECPAMDEICEQCRIEPFVLPEAIGWARSVVSRISLKSVICRSLRPFGIPFFLVCSPLVNGPQSSERRPPLNECENTRLL